MDKKVSLREIVGTKIIFAMMLVMYYWMWARTDWQGYYDLVQKSFGIFFVVFFVTHGARIRQYKKECFDELAEQNLRRCDAICLKLFMGAMIVAAWMCAIIGHVNTISAAIVGWVIVLSIMVISIVRTIMFSIMDQKGV